MKYIGSLFIPAIVLGVALLVAHGHCKQTRLIQPSLLPANGSVAEILPSKAGSSCLFSEWSSWDACDLKRCMRSKHRAVERLVSSIDPTGTCEPCSTICDEQCAGSTCELLPVLHDH
jgi:hypothetical protein